MAIAIAQSTNRLDRIAHTIFHANGQFPAREPREWGIIRRLLEVDLNAPLDLVVQIGAILTEFGRVKVFAAHLGLVVPEFVGDIAAIGRLGRQRRRRWRCGRRGLGGRGPVDMIPIVIILLQNYTTGSTISTGACLRMVCDLTVG